MKKFQVLLYVASIVVAVFIGMGKVGKEESVIGSDVPNCTTWVEERTCGTQGICEKLKYYLETPSFTQVGNETWYAYNATDVVYIAGPPSTYQCYVNDELPCSIWQSFTYKKPPSGCTACSVKP